MDYRGAWVKRRAENEMIPLSGKNPARLAAQLLTEWPLVSAPMARQVTSFEPCRVQRNLPGWKTQGLIPRK